MTASSPTPVDAHPMNKFSTAPARSDTLGGPIAHGLQAADIDFSRARRIA